ncbi:hypothetical protein [Halorubrum ezzemoulense]|uniref:Uncharacterized protein n=1 Tax=Halorubrum ezzemoulense TaxID=337243 RepID=A0A256JGZ7_HALEZ|nr:hypothetical protein [Halorubrum ezzemoulense]OYR68155.1 hypothetical protein DJ78_14570 [Halorubrum ezzemoulense]
MGDQIVIDEDDLEDVYLDLVDATGAASQGNPNECASKAADAKEQVLAIHEEAETLEEVDERD